MTESSAYRIFRMQEGIDYEFAMPGILIGGEGVTREMVDGRWRLTQRLNGLEWVAEHESQVCAVLLLIATRMGYVGELRPAEGDDG